MNGGFTVRAWVTRDGNALLKPLPEEPEQWLSELLQTLTGCEVIVTVSVHGHQRPPWVARAAKALEGGPARPPRITVAEAWQLGAGR